MLTIGDSVRTGGRLARRPFLRVGSAGLAGLAGLTSLFGRSPTGMATAAPNDPAARFLRDRSVIFLFMHGGPSQFETFDPKSEGPSSAHSQTGAIATSIPGISFGSTFAELAKRADRLNIVRSFVTGDGNHDIKPVVGAATNRANLGSLYARVAGANRPATAMPTNVTLFPPAVIKDAGPPITDFGNFAAAGDLGPAFAPLVPGGSGAGSLPSSTGGSGGAISPRSAVPARSKTPPSIPSSGASPTPSIWRKRIHGLSSATTPRPSSGRNRSTRSGTTTSTTPIMASRSAGCSSSPAASASVGRGLSP